MRKKNNFTQKASRKYFSLFDEKSHCSKVHTLMFTLNFPCYGSVIFVRIVHITPPFHTIIAMMMAHGGMVAEKTTLHFVYNITFSS